MKIKDLIEITGAEIIECIDEHLEIKISTDTRTICEGDFYLPLKGENFDGEKFIEQALNNGAVGTFCTTKPLINIQNKTILKVPNTLIAYLQLANWRRNRINPQVVAITGSSGKTTTKELVSAVLSEKFNVFKTPLNHNNEVGLCQTLFQMPKETEILVLEMGMRGLGEIELLSKYAEPDITLISNVGTAHIGRLGSKENIAKAKCEIVKYQRGKIFIAHDNQLIKNTVDFSGEQIYYSIKDVEIIEKNAQYSKFVYKNNIYELNVGGDYNIENAIGAINVGLSLSMSIEQIQKGLRTYRPIEKRWEETEVNGIKIVNDSYNANPESMRAFVDTVFELYDNYSLILGDMGELGENEKIYHQEIGKYIDSHKNLKQKSTILTIGNLSKEIHDNINNCAKKHFKQIEELVNYIKTDFDRNNILFLKASRSMKLEKIIELLK